MEWGSRYVCFDEGVSLAVELEGFIGQGRDVFLERLKCHVPSLVDSALCYHRDHTGLLERVSMCHYQVPGEKNHTASREMKDWSVVCTAVVSKGSSLQL